MGVLDGEGDLLAVGHLEVVAVGIGDDPPVADGRPVIEGAQRLVAGGGRVRQAPVDLVAALTR